MLKVSDIKKSYNNSLALQGISFSAQAGEIIGLLGPNGSGKSTCLKILTGVTAPSSGSVEYEDLVLPRDINKLRSELAYVPEEVAIYPELKVREYLKFVAALKQVESASETIQQLIEDLNLQSVANRVCVELSKGFKQRVVLAQALLSKPRYLFLDEPNTGLDPANLQTLHQVLSSRSKEMVIVLSSHQLAEVQKLCTRVVALSFGKKVFDKQASELNQVELEKIYIQAEQA